MVGIPRDIEEALMAVVPVECGQCYVPPLLACALGKKVMAREVSLTDAEYMLLEDLCTHCFRDTVPEGCMKPGDCQYDGPI